MSVFIIKLIDVLIIYLISTYVHNFMFKIYIPLPYLPFPCMYNSVFAIWSYIIPISIVAIQLSQNI